LLKLYVAEPESSTVKAAAQNASLVYAYAIAYAEVRAGFAKAVRMQRLSLSELKIQRGFFESDWRNMEIIAATDAIIRRAGDLAEQFGLRGCENVHLAAAEAVWRNAPGVDFRFLVFDGDLVEAARILKIPLFG
jgi:predicted nucleic acid-binding protein